MTKAIRPRARMRLEGYWRQVSIYVVWICVVQTMFGCLFMFSTSSVYLQMSYHYIVERLKMPFLPFFLDMSKETRRAALWKEDNLDISLSSCTDSSNSCFISWFFTTGSLTSRIWVLQFFALMVLVLPLLFKTNRIDASGPDSTGRSEIEVDYM